MVTFQWVLFFTFTYTLILIRSQLCQWLPSGYFLKIAMNINNLTSTYALFLWKISNFSLTENSKQLCICHLAKFIVHLIPTTPDFVPTGFTWSEFFLWSEFCMLQYFIHNYFQYISPKYKDSLLKHSHNTVENCFFCGIKILVLTLNWGFLTWFPSKQ